MPAFFSRDHLVAWLLARVAARSRLRAAQQMAPPGVWVLPTARGWGTEKALVAVVARGVLRVLVVLVAPGVSLVAAVVLAALALAAAARAAVVVTELCW